MLDRFLDVRVAVVATAMAARSEPGLFAALAVVLVLALAVAVVLVRRRRRRLAEEARLAAARAELHEQLRTLFDDAGGLYDQCLTTEAERGMAMLDRWRSTHSP